MAMAFWQADPVKFVGNFNSNTDGTWSIANMMAGIRYLVQPMSANAFVESLVLTGTTLSGTFKIANTGGLGITLGTLLTVQAFNTPTSAVNFSVFAAQDLPLS